MPWVDVKEVKKNEDKRLQVNSYVNAYIFEGMLLKSVIAWRSEILHVKHKECQGAFPWLAMGVSLEMQPLVYLKQPTVEGIKS